LLHVEYGVTDLGSDLLMPLDELAPGLSPTSCGDGGPETAEEREDSVSRSPALFPQNVRTPDAAPFSHSEKGPKCPLSNWNGRAEMSSP